jgi:hypothetical protein
MKVESKRDDDDELPLRLSRDWARNAAAEQTRSKRRTERVMMMMMILVVLASLLDYCIVLGYCVPIAGNLIRWGKQKAFVRRYPELTYTRYDVRTSKRFERFMSKGLAGAAHHPQCRWHV